jgi:catechol 2,3-dioxygenase-like lactoylglutathione lyase family enzyme
MCLDDGDSVKRFAFFFAVLLSYATAASSDAPKRPRILGIAGVKVFSTDLRAARNFYSQALGAKETSPNTFSLNSHQVVSLFSVPSPAPSNFLAEVVFETDSLGGLLRYLTAQKIQVTPHLVTVRRWDVFGPGYSTLSVTDPDGHRISFIHRTKSPRPSNRLPSTSPMRAQHIIHAGFVVKNFDLMKKFYEDLLGFRLYWQGGFMDDGLDWYEIQVPDGSDWIEFMLNIPADADHKELGVQNHFSLGVKDIHAAAEQLRKNGLQNFGGPEIGRDGKWSLDAYDPDGTRVEFMEFTPVQEPCCSEYTGPHPKP